MENIDHLSFYLVRSTAELINQEIVGVGWSDYNFSAYADVEDVIGDIENDYGIGRRANQLRRFFNIKENDIIVVPLPYAVAIGRAVGKMFYDDNYNSKDADQANQFRINIPKDEKGNIITIPRISFSESFQRRIRVQGMTVNDLSEFGEEIFKALDSIQSGQEYKWYNQINLEIEKKQMKFKKQLLNNIQSGQTNLKTGGIGLEELICELLIIEGYNAKILSKKKFSSFADADIQASKSDRCSIIEILIQVKHHQGYSNEYGLKQLEELINLHQKEFEGFELIFITSASVTEELLLYAENTNIKVLQGSDLVDWIAEHIDDLSDKTKKVLGIFEVPSVI